MLLMLPGFGQLLIIVILWPFLLNVDDKFMRTDSAPLNISEYKKIVSQFYVNTVSQILLLRFIVNDCPVLVDKKLFMWRSGHAWFGSNGNRYLQVGDLS